jgi:uncharacterized protein (UPF0179 family)
MAMSSWILAVLGSFYVVLGASLVFRGCKPSCRTCVYWQHCLNKQLGLQGEKHIPCIK